VFLIEMSDVVVDVVVVGGGGGVAFVGSAIDEDAQIPGRCAEGIQLHHLCVRTDCQW
jgi:hypothetical protein